MLICKCPCSEVAFYKDTPNPPECPGLRQAPLVGSAWIEAEDGSAITVRNPTTGEVVGRLPRLGPEETRTAIEVAEVAQRDWAARNARDIQAFCTAGIWMFSRRGEVTAINSHSLRKYAVTHFRGRKGDHDSIGPSPFRNSVRHRATVQEAECSDGNQQDRQIWVASMNNDSAADESRRNQYLGEC